MPQARRPGGATAVFSEHSFSEDVERASAAAADVARAARRRYESEGVPILRLRICTNEGDDGTSLPGCLKVYLPEPAGRFGMVFRLVAHPSGSRLRYLGFGVRHHPPGSHALTVYQLAHRRLHG